MSYDDSYVLQLINENTSLKCYAVAILMQNYEELCYHGSPKQTPEEYIKNNMKKILGGDEG